MTVVRGVGALVVLLLAVVGVASAQPTESLLLRADKVIE